MALNGGIAGDGNVFGMGDLRLAIACGAIDCPLGNAQGRDRGAQVKPSTIPTLAASGLQPGVSDGTRNAQC